MEYVQYAKILLIMLALCLMFFSTYYAENYACIIDHFSRSHGMLIEKLINYNISTGVLWRLEYFLYHDQSLLKNYFCLCSCKYYEPLEGYS